MLCFRTISAWGYLSSEGVQVSFGTRGYELPAVLQYAPKEMRVYSALDFLCCGRFEVLAAFLYPFPYAAAKGKNDSPLMRRGQLSAELISAISWNFPIT